MQESDAEVSVSLQHVDFRTDCSRMRPFFNCLNAMMTPLKADEELDDEVQNLRCMVQLMPQVCVCSDACDASGVCVCISSVVCVC